MKRPQFLAILIALSIVFVAIWTAQTLLPQHAKTSTATGISPSLYLTGTQVIPTINVPTATANCDSRHIPGITSDPAGGTGSPAIKPHLCNIPTFTQQDVRQYMDSMPSFTGLRIAQRSPHFTVTRILFVTNQTANDILNADTGIIDKSLIVCYVEVYGDFTVASPFSPKNTKQTILHHGQMVFDGVTGNMLVIGVLP